MLYRALDNLSVGIGRGQVFNVGRLKATARAVLEAQGVITPVNAPPVAGVDEWIERAVVLSESGIVTLADVLLFSGIPAGVEAETWTAWRAEAEAALTIKCVGCRR